MKTTHEQRARALVAAWPKDRRDRLISFCVSQGTYDALQAMPDTDHILRDAPIGPTDTTWIIWAAKDALPW